MSREILPRLVLALYCAGAPPGLAWAQAELPASGSAAANGIGLKLPPDWIAKPRQTASDTVSALQPGAADKSLATILYTPANGPRLGRELDAGVASWYGPHFHGRRTANGERFNRHALTAAHKTLPLGTRVLVLNPRTGKQVVVRINDRGPYTRHRKLDLSEAAAYALGLRVRGTDWVVMYEVLPTTGTPDSVANTADTASTIVKKIAMEADWSAFPAASSEANASVAEQQRPRLTNAGAP